MFPSMFNQTENGTTEGDSTHPKMEGGKERRKRGTAKNRGSQGRVMEDYGNWRQTERVVGDQAGWQGSIR